MGFAAATDWEAWRTLPWPIRPVGWGLASVLCMRIPVAAKAERAWSMCPGLFQASAEPNLSCYQCCGRQHSALGEDHSPLPSRPAAYRDPQESLISNHWCSKIAWTAPCMITRFTMLQYSCWCGRLQHHILNTEACKLALQPCSGWPRPWQTVFSNFLGGKATCLGDYIQALPWKLQTWALKPSNLILCRQNDWVMYQGCIW